MFNKRPFGQVEKKERPQVKSCKRTIKRDDQGRIVQEKFEGCSSDQIKQFRENDDKES